MGVKFVNDADLTTVADAIRAKGGTQSPMVFPSGMAAAIAEIQTGGNLPTLTLPAQESDVRFPREYIDGYGNKKTGTSVPIIDNEIRVKNNNGTLYTETAVEAFLLSGQHGAVSAASLDANLIAGNIRQGVSVFGVAGTCQVGYTDFTVTGFTSGNGQILLDWIAANLPALAVGESRAAAIIGNTSTSNYAMRFFTQHVTDSERWIINITRSGSCISITQSTSTPAGTQCYISDGTTIRVYDKVVF